jgi:hypothetical protein
MSKHGAKLSFGAGGRKLYIRTERGLFLENGGDFLLEDFRLERLHEVVRGTRLNGFDAGHIGHVPIHQYEVERTRGEFCKRFQPVARRVRCFRS